MPCVDPPPLPPAPMDAQKADEVSSASSGDATARAPRPTVFVPMCCDFMHVGHINILNKSNELGNVTVLLMTDEAMRLYKRNPAMPFEHRKRIVGSMIQVHDVIACRGLQHFAPLCRKHRPKYFVHGDDWKNGPQQNAREEVIRVLRGFGGTVVEPVYTPSVSSTKSQSDFHASTKTSYNTGVLIRTALNDVKRDVAVAAEETQLSNKLLLRLLRGHEFDGCNIDAATRLLGHMYPISKRMMLCDEDSSDAGAWFMTSQQTSKSQRVFDRTNANGNTVPYYKYMDTATSAISPFKPELIEQLVQVEDNDPMNPRVVMNKGHMLGQATYFIGPVNFYWTVRGERRCRAMNTGDSCLITPYVPHSFTSRDTSQYSAIVEVTFAGCVREALPQLLHLDSDALNSVTGDMREPRSLVASRILRFAELRGMDIAAVRTRLEESGQFDGQTIDKIVRGDIKEVPAAAAALAATFGVPTSEFIIGELEASKEVVFATAPTKDLPGKYAFAHAEHMTDIGGFEWRLEEGVEEEESSQFYRYVYNTGNASIKVEWFESGASETSAVHPSSPSPIPSFFFRVVCDAFRQPLFSSALPLSYAASSPYASAVALAVQRVFSPHIQLSSRMQTLIGALSSLTPRQ